MSYRFLTLLGLLAVACCTGYAAAVLAGASLTDIRALDGIASEHERWHIRPVTPAELYGLKSVLVAALGLSGAGVIGLLMARKTRAEINALGTELRAATGGLSIRWTSLPPRAKLPGLAGLALLTVLRTYFSLTKPVHPEEIASYEYFVREGLLAVSAYYPIPNNHVLSNALSCAFYQVHPAFWWSMRLPVLLVSTVGTAALALGLLRWTNHRVAFWGTAGFSWLQLCLYNASAGRGYWLLITLAGTVFFCTVALARQACAGRMAWAGLLAASLAGCYTVPTFAYAFASALAWLGWLGLRRQDWPLLSRLLLVAAAVALGCAALYSPALLVSGARVYGNGFVAAREASAFWPGLPAYLWFTEGLLTGQRTVGAAAALVALAASVYMLRAQGTRAKSALTTEEADQRRLLAAALWFAVFPYALVMLQRVFPPERVLLYKSFFLFIVVGTVADSCRQYVPLGRPRRFVSGVMLMVFAAFASYQTYYVEFLNRRLRTQVAAYRAAQAWLQAQPPGAVLAPEPLHDMYFRFFSHTGQAPYQSTSDMTARPGRHYTYVAAFPNKRGAFQPSFSFAPAFANDEVEIFVLPNPNKP